MQFSSRSKILTVFLPLLILELCLTFTFVQCESQAAAPKTPKKSYRTQPQPQNVAIKAQMAPANKTARVYPAFEDESRFCLPDHPWINRPFYRSRLDGAVCCRGNIVQSTVVMPETSGECAISTKTDANGLLQPAPLWCAYTCSLKKIGVIDATGNVKPVEFFNHLAKSIGQKSKDNLKLIMEKHLKCMTPFKNPKFPCFTPLGFHKCYQDALEHLCIHGVPKDNDFSKIPPVNNDYVNISPTCKIGGKQVMPECCHNKPLPWTVADIVEAPRNQAAHNTCLTNMNSRLCEATCFMNSAGVVNDSMELDVDEFNKKILGLFPVVQRSVWMDYLGPTYVFFDETLEEMHARLSYDLRVCLFHDKILNYHEDKIRQYCSMTPEQVKEIKTKQGN